MFGGNGQRPADVWWMVDVGVGVSDGRVLGWRPMSE